MYSLCGLYDVKDVIELHYPKEHIELLKLEESKWDMLGALTDLILLKDFQFLQGHYKMTLLRMDLQTDETVTLRRALNNFNEHELAMRVNNGAI